MSLNYKSAYQLYSEETLSPRMYTGFADLDMLLGGGLKLGFFYLMYGDGESGIDWLIHKILVESLKPLEKNGFAGKSLYINCGNYKYERTILDVELLCWLAKSADLNLQEALDKIHCVCAFSEEQEEQIVNEVCGLIEKDMEIKMVVIHNLAKLFTDTAHTPNKNTLRKIPRLQRVIGRIFQSCSKHNVALVVSCRPNKTVRGFIPAPEGGKYLRHLAGVIVHFRRIGKTPTVQASLLKHPRRPRGTVNFTLTEGDFMGRITIPFRTRVQEQLDELKRSFQPALMNQMRRKAFEDLSKVWTSEQGAMSYCNIPTVLDVMLLTGLVDDRKVILEINERLNKIEVKLEKAINSHSKSGGLSKNSGEAFRFLREDLASIEKDDV